MNKKEKTAYFSALGRKGGKNNVKKNGRKHMAEIGRRGALGRIKVLTKRDLEEAKK